MGKAEVIVETLGGQGDGIAQGPGGRLYVPFTAPGDHAEVAIAGPKGDGRAATLMSLQQSGPIRVEPPCRHFGICGGCALQHIADKPYATWKRDLVVSVLERRGLDAGVVGDLVRTKPGARRRADLAAKRTVRGVILGFHRAAGKQIVDLAECPSMDPALAGLFGPLRNLLADLLPVAASASMPVLASDTGISLLIETKVVPSLEQRERITAFAEAHDLAAVAMRDPASGHMEPLAQRRAPAVTLGSVGVAVPPGAFLQATQESQAALVREVLAGAGEADHVADLFSGIGTFALPLAARAKAHAVEGDAELARALESAVNRTAGKTNLSVEVRDLFRRPLQPLELKRFDAVVFDPPRAGARDQAVALAESSVPAVIAVSCNPSTFARDVRLLVEGGYTLRRVVPVDQFLWSPHVEMVGILRR